MKRRRPGVRQSVGTVHVRARAATADTPFARAGSSQWWIIWHYKDRGITRQSLPQPLGVNCWVPLDTWVPIWEGATGFSLVPLPAHHPDAGFHPLHACECSQHTAPGQLGIDFQE